jgi:hypothetical protein
MWHAVNMLVARGGEDANELYWVIAVIVLSVIGTIAGKIKERAARKTPPTSPRQAEPPPESKEGASSVPSARRPSPPAPRPREPASRPMPRVPRPPVRPGGRPAPASGQSRPMPVPQRPGPGPMRPTIPTRPTRPTPPPRSAERPAARPAEPALRPVESVIVVEEVAVERPSSRGGPASGRPETPAAARRSMPLAVRLFKLTPARLREAIVLNEVLGPPVSMRDSEHLF